MNLYRLMMVFIRGHQENGSPVIVADVEERFYTASSDQLAAIVGIKAAGYVVEHTKPFYKWTNFRIQKIEVQPINEDGSISPYKVIDTIIDAEPMESDQREQQQETKQDAQRGAGNNKADHHL